MSASILITVWDFTPRTHRKGIPTGLHSDFPINYLPGVAFESWFRSPKITRWRSRVRTKATVDSPKIALNYDQVIVLERVQLNETTKLCPKMGQLSANKTNSTLKNRGNEMIHWDKRVHRVRTEFSFELENWELSRERKAWTAPKCKTNGKT